MKPNAQHKALRRSGIFRPRVERDRRRQAQERAALQQLKEQKQ